MHKIVILIGGNQGDRKALIISAMQMLESKVGNCVKASSIYESEAWGFQSENTFFNQVLVFDTQLKPHDLLQIALGIENELGRLRAGKDYASRTMDIDLLFYNDQIIKDNDLQIPHPRLHLRRFTLEPLAEILPNYVHPELNKTMLELLVSCDDQASINKLDNQNAS